MGYSIFDDTMVEMSWPAIEKAASRGAIILLPVGIIEEHGPHMGLAVDTYAPYLIARLTRQTLAKRKITALIAPPPYWGVSLGTSVFPGTFSIRPQTMQALIYDILASLHSWGFKKVFAINWHADMEHVKTVYNAFKDARRALGIDAVCLADEFSLRRLRLTGREDYILKYQAPMDMGMGEKYIDVHAGSMETAVMAKYFPDHVNTALAKKLKRTKLTIDDLKVLGGTGKTTRKLIPDGYFGNPAGYPAVEVEKIINAEVKSAADVIQGYLKKK